MQALAVSDQSMGSEFSAIYSSDILRARQTAELIAKRQRDPLNMRAPQGESPRHVAERVISTLIEIAAQHRKKSILIVSHGIPLALMSCQAQGLPFDNVNEHISANAKPFRLKWS